MDIMERKQPLENILAFVLISQSKRISLSLSERGKIVDS
jgi:hypothetical protein